MFAILEDRKGFRKDQGFVPPYMRYIDIFEYEPLEFRPAESLKAISSKKLTFVRTENLGHDVWLFKEL